MPSSEITSEPRHPKRLEKNANKCRLLAQVALPDRAEHHVRGDGGSIDDQTIGGGAVHGLVGSDQLVDAGLCQMSGTSLKIVAHLRRDSGICGELFERILAELWINFRGQTCG